MFIETPSDLFMQSSTWSNYKHHNTGKFLIGCSPNGAISYVSQLYVGSISDVELTRVSGYLKTLEGKGGVSVMADRGFTVRDMLAEKGVDINIPPFLEGREQLPADEVKHGRSIASLRIHVERAIGRIKNYTILKGTLPITMICVANQCAWLTNFQPALVPLSSDSAMEDEVLATSSLYKTVTTMLIQRQVMSMTRWKNPNTVKIYTMFIHNYACIYE